MEAKGVKAGTEVKGGDGRCAEVFPVKICYDPGSRGGRGPHGQHGEPGLPGSPWKKSAKFGPIGSI